MVFALLFAAIIWNLGTWWLGLPASSSHTLIGSIIGVGIANALMQGRDGTAGVDWSHAVNVGYALLLSPIIGFICAALLLLTLKYSCVSRRFTCRGAKRPTKARAWRSSSRQPRRSDAIQPNQAIAPPLLPSSLARSMLKSTNMARCAK